MPSRVVPVAREGWPFILPPLAAAGVAGWAGWRAAGGLLALVGGFMVYFFRDPERAAPGDAGAILAPADGRVVEVRAPVEDPFVGPAQQVSIFLSPLDVHVNRAPLAGLVVEVTRRPGGHLAAYRAEASRQNEQTSVAIQGETARVVVRQIAGVLARRIVCRLHPGDKVQAGERFGMIKFGSRTELVVPARARLSVKAGDRVRAGETIVGVLA